MRYRGPLLGVAHLLMIPACLAWPSSVSAQGKTDETMIEASEADPSPGELGIIDYNHANNTERGFSAHRRNYVLPFAFSSYGEGRQRSEAKFQISVKQRLLRFRGWAAYLGFTQKSFWQLYDGERSRPFREHNFAPELFVRTSMWQGLRLDVGIEHESNGQSGLASRSWNRIHLAPYYENDRLSLSLKVWYRLPERTKRDENDPGGDDNPDIDRYYGHAELAVTLKLPELNRMWVSVMSRLNIVTGMGAVEVDATWPLYLSSMMLVAQYWEGYGESLIDYNIRQRKIGIGLGFSR